MTWFKNQSAVPYSKGRASFFPNIFISSFSKNVIAVSFQKIDGARFIERRLVYLSEEYKLSAIRFAPNLKPLQNPSITISVCIAV